MSKVIKRYRAVGSWTAATAIRTGGDEDSFLATSDLPILRDREGNPYISGASIAGAARNLLAAYQSVGDEWMEPKDEVRALRILMGDDYASPLTVWDAPLELPKLTRIRDGVKVDLDNGIAADKAKYDYEVLPSGTQFRMKFDLDVYDEHFVLVGETRESVSGSEVEGQFKKLLFALRDGNVRLGARARRGLGEGSAKFTVRCLNMSKPEHLLAWLQEKWELGDQVRLPDEGLEDPRSRFIIDAEMELKTSLLIRSAGESADDPDMVHLTEDGKAILSGSSLAGALRARCQRIAITVGHSPGRAEELVEKMFGPKAGLDEDPTKPLFASRIETAETILPGELGQHLFVQGRVTIDRFTQGALDAHLFDQAAYWPLPNEKISLRITLARPEPSMIGLLLQAVKDLWLGDLPIGGEASVGRGVFNGHKLELSYIVRNAEPRLLTITRLPDGDIEKVHVKGWDKAWETVAVAHLPTPHEPVREVGT